MTKTSQTAWPTKMDVTVPKGVTVTPFRGNYAAPKEPRNILEQAALCDHRDFAASLVASLLKIDGHDHLMKANLSEPDRWARVSRETRLMELGNWLRAECFELLDLQSIPAFSTIGD